MKKINEFNVPLVEASCPTKPVDWLDSKFVPCRVLFPQWITAYACLTDFVRKTGDWAVVFDQSECNVGLKFPYVWDQLHGEWVPMVEAFPPEDRPRVKSICKKLVEDYMPILDHMLREAITPHTEAIIRSEIKGWEQHIISMGGRSVHEELGFRLGVMGAITGLDIGLEVECGEQ